MKKIAIRGGHNFLATGCSALMMKLQKIGK